MIDTVTIEGFKNHLSTEIALGRFTLLVGPNAAGKSSALEALQVISRSVTESPGEIFRGDTELSNILQREEAGLSIALSGYDAGFLLQEGAKTKFALKLGAFTFEQSSNEQGVEARRVEKAALTWSIGEESGVLEYKQSPRDNLPPRLRSCVGRATFLRLEGRKLARARYDDSSSPRLGSSGEGLVNVLAEMLLAGDGGFALILEELKKVVPAVTNLRIRRTPVVQDIVITEELNGPYKRRVIESREVTGEELYFDFVHAKDIPASLVSEGTLIALGILTAVHVQEGTSLVLLDDLDRGLHPRAQAELIDIIKRLLEEKPELQIVATTHSPYLIDAVDADDVWVLALDDTGIPDCARLSDHPDARKALEVLMPGEFYSSEDEAWVIERSKNSNE